jgi:hypothetical protein
MTYPMTPVSAVPRLTGLIAALFVLVAGCAAARPATQPVQRASAWGSEVNGLRARLKAPAEIEQNAPLAVSFELRCDPGSVPAGITGFDSYRVCTHLQLTLTDVTTGQAFDIGPREFSTPLLASYLSDNASLLGGTSLKPIQTEFPLRAAGEGLKAGVYDCVVSYSSERGHRGDTEGRRSKELWRGELRTAPARLTIQPEVLRNVTFQVPKRLRLMPDQKVVYQSEDTDRVTAMLGNGMYVGRRIVCHSGSQEHFEELGGVPPPKPGDSDPIDDWSLADRRPVNGNLEYTIEVFATADPPGHMWEPEENDYKTLWKKEFVVPDNTPRK